VADIDIAEEQYNGGERKAGKI